MICQECADAADYGDVPHCNDVGCPCQHREDRRVTEARARLRRAAARWREVVTVKTGDSL